jgi:hypothetical protein
MRFLLNVPCLNSSFGSQCDVLYYSTISVGTFKDACFKNAVEIGIEGAQDASLILFPIEFINPSGG